MGSRAKKLGFSEPILTHASLVDPRVRSYVYTFSGNLGMDSNFGGPEPDFLRWVEGAIIAELALSSDEAEDLQLPEEEREAWALFYKSIKATGNLIELYQCNPKLFGKISSRLSLLPCFMSWHPDSERTNRQLLKDSRLGQRSMYGELQRNPRHVMSQTWPVRYAYAVIATIELTLDSYKDRLPGWGRQFGYGVRHPVPLSSYEASMVKAGWEAEKIARELPKYADRYCILPSWTKLLSRVRRPFNQAHVLDYWRVGKELILEEMPAFQDRPEWKTYHQRHFASGSKGGAIQHAIFKDILAALKTIAGTGKKKKC